MNIFKLKLFNTVSMDKKINVMFYDIIGFIKFVFLFRSFSVSRLHIPEKQQNNATIILKIMRFLLSNLLSGFYCALKSRHNKFYKQTLIITTTLYKYIYIYTIIHNLILLLN